MITRRTALTGGVAATLAATIGRARAANTPGVTATEVKIGNTMPYSGPASAYASIGKGEAAYFKMLNEAGGIAGRKLNFLSLDDGYSPPKTVEDVRRLVEQERVDFLFQCLGTPCNSAIQRYCNSRKVPQLFVASGASKWNNPKKYPWTMGWQPSYRTEAQIYTKYLMQEKPDAKLGILYQNDDFGKDYYVGVKDVLGDKFGKVATKVVTYEVTDPTIDSQIAQLQSSGVDAILVAATPKFAAQAIRKVHNLNWHPVFFLTNVSISVGTVMNPAGPANAKGIITTEYLKDPTDPHWNDDAGMKQFKAFMAKHMPSADIRDSGYIYSYSVAATMAHVLKQCDGDFSRPNVLKQASSIGGLELPTLLPGIKIGTTPTDYRPIKAMQLARWTGTDWQLFGKVIAGV